MTDLRFDGRVAIVTGAGGDPSLGRAHALLLASRGARVVVNDIGKDPEDVYYKGEASAAAVAEEIRRAGGDAVADTNSVANEAGAAAIVRTAVEAFGKVDILVNNAGVCPIVGIDRVPTADVLRTFNVNILGPVWLSRAVWPLMSEAGYGRIVNISSGALTGLPMLSIYGATKGALFSLTRALAVEGLGAGIKVNSVSPAAYTRMLIAMQEPGSKLLELAEQTQPAELVSPVVAMLCHESCPVNGENFNSAGGRVSRTFLCETQGFTDTNLSLEVFRDRFAQVMDEADHVVWGPGSFGRDDELTAEEIVEKATPPA